MNAVLFFRVRVEVYVFSVSQISLTTCTILLSVQHRKILHICFTSISIDKNFLPYNNMIYSIMFDKISEEHHSADSGELLYETTKTDN